MKTGRTHTPFIGQSPTGFKPTGNYRYQQIVTAAGKLTAVQPLSEGEYDLTIHTHNGAVTLRQGEEHGYAPEVTTFTPGTSEGRTPHTRAPERGPGLEHAVDPLLLAHAPEQPEL